MREDKHTSLSKNDDWPNTEIPFSVELNIHSHEDIFLRIPLENLIRSYKAVLSHNNKNCRVHKGHKEYIHHNADVILCNILVSHVVTNEVEDVSDQDVDESNPYTEVLGLIRLDVTDLGPIFAML
jgi:hypothetical protein